ncbi:Hypothetical predicted protein [Paramuricea clavata]|uniref:Uncharacterized protein n=1 Tax=Paramuricea clavata TaxID=317549 RepID=A0A6S7HBW5_PARCT|nr:Hypothetical predicted protein [Paramuricea clavata]
MKKKKFKFDVSFELRELSNVSLASGLLFSKLRLLDGGKFTETSCRLDVSNNRVRWHQTFQFGCKMTANSGTGYLDPCLCRISVRKETKGGKSYEKLGFVEVNMAEFAGPSKQTRKYLLEGHDDKANRQDNSILEVRISMQLRQGDPLFKLPNSPQAQVSVESPNCKGESSKGKKDDRGLDETSAGTVTVGTITPDTPTSPMSASPDGEEDTVAKLALAEGSSGLVGKVLGHHRSASEPPFLRDGHQSGQLSEGYGSMTTQSTSSCSDAGRRFNSIERTASKVTRSRVDACNIVEQIINSQESEEPQGHTADTNRNESTLISFLMDKNSNANVLPSDCGLVVDDKYRTL